MFQLKDNLYRDPVKSRAILANTVFRFFPQIQTIRDSALVGIVERILVFYQTEKGLKPHQISDLFRNLYGCSLTNIQVELALKSLVEQGSVIEIGKKNRFCKCTQKAIDAITELVRESERLLSKIVDLLFANSDRSVTDYYYPFLYALSIIFSNLGDNCIRVIRGEAFDGHNANRLLEYALKKTAAIYKGVVDDYFESRIIFFFEDSRTPEFTTLKWNMSQNYYISKSLGFDPTGTLLSEELFQNAIFYLDTNILIAALGPELRNFNTILAIITACKRLNIEFRICEISILELKIWASRQHQLLEKVLDQIPTETAPKVRSSILQLFNEKKAMNSEITVSDIMSPFEDPKEHLPKSLDADYEDDTWFDENKDSPEIRKFANKIAQKYLALRKRNKHEKSALHDSLLMNWISKKIKDENEKAWLITMDTSLTSLKVPSMDRTCAVNLDSIVQWLSPLGSSTQESFEEVFAEMIKNWLLPQERVFDLEDFLLFDELNMNCKSLPAEDVEECLRFIRKNAPTLNPHRAKDREKLMYTVSKFFADPGRKYAESIDRMEKEKQELQTQLKLRKQEIEQVKCEMSKNLSEKDHQIEALSDKIKSISYIILESQKRRKTIWKLTIGVVVFLVFCGGITFVSLKYVKGDN